MSATVTDIGSRRPRQPHKAKCDDCGAPYYRNPRLVRRWARAHARAFHHTVRTNDGLVVSVVNGHEVTYS